MSGELSFRSEPPCSAVLNIGLTIRFWNARIADQSEALSHMSAESLEAATDPIYVIAH